MPPPTTFKFATGEHVDTGSRRHDVRYLADGPAITTMDLTPQIGAKILNNSNNTWLGQVTTGHGFMVLAPTLLAALSGTLSWTNAIPLLVASAVGLLWPENAPLRDAAKSAATDLEKAYAAYRDNTVAAATNAPVPPDPRKTAAGIAVLLAFGISLAACTDQTAAQQSATVHAVACAADAVAKVAATETTPASDLTQAVNAAVALGNQLTTDPNCAPLPAAPAAPEGNAGK